jgi:hypothetical protein
MVARRSRWRGNATRLPPVSKLKRWSRRGELTVDGHAADQHRCQLECQRNTVEALANPDRRHVARRASANAAFVRGRVRRTASACAYSSTASGPGCDCMGGTGNDGTRQLTSRSGSGLTARRQHLSPGAGSSSLSTTRAQPSRRCSQLSSTSKSRRGFSAATSVRKQRLSGHTRAP